MARHFLSPREIQVAREGDHSDGDGLILRVTAKGASWVLRYTSPTGRRRRLGLGAADRSSIEAAGASAKRARKKADEAREQLDEKIDPIDAKRQQRAAGKAAAAAERADAESAKMTLARVARGYHEEVIEPSRTTKHAAQWIATLEQHLFPKLGNKPIAEVTAPDLLSVLADLQQRVPETTARIRQRVDAVFEHALFHGWVTANPAASLRRKLREGRSKRERGHHAAMPYRQVPDFMAKLAEAEGTSARCLEFLILTASRTSEALNAQWPEFDLAGGIWTIPGERMKAREPHVMHLSPRAVEIVKRQEGQHKRYVFPSMWNDGRPLSNMSLLMTLRRLKVEDATVHGFRASFSSWANECSIAQPDAIEAALAHCESNLVRRAYNRAAFLAERRALMTAWCDYLAGRPLTRADGSAVSTAQVLEFPRPQAA